MPVPADPPSIGPRELADLSALADGSLDPARREEVSARIAASPELSALYERERRVVEVLHEARSTDRAPVGLRARIGAERPSRKVRSRRRFSYGGAVAAALAAVALALALILPSGSPGAPSVSQAADLAVRGAAVSAPTPDPDSPAKLNLRVNSVYFPNWSQRFRSPATGARSDHINGRLAVTVYYKWRGQALAYTIVGGPSLSTPSARVSMVDGTVFRTLSENGRTIVTWRRAGHTCVLSAKGVPTVVLHRLAAWEAPAVES
jgi:hypothetical protein